MVSSNVILTQDHLEAVVRHFKQFDAFAFDLEAAGDHRGVPAHNTITWLSMATHGMCVVIPMGHDRGEIIGETTEPRTLKNGSVRNYKVPVWSPAPEQLRPSQVWEAVAPLFFSDRIKTGHNVAYDIASLAKYYDGQVPSTPWFDTFINSVLIDENRLNGLKARVKQLYGVVYDQEQIGKCVEKFAFSKVAKYSYLDSKFAWLIYKREHNLAKKQGLSEVLDLEIHVMETVVEMMLNGAPIDTTVLEEFGKELDARLVQIEGDIYRGVGKKFNLNSSPQKSTILYSKKKDGGLGLKPHALTKGGKKKKRRGDEILITDYSTDSDALEPHKDHPVVANILKYQKNDKLKSTYVTGILGEEGNPEKPCRVIDGRVHGSFKQMGARTGRWSSAEPNLQNIPARGDDGKRIRSAYRAETGYKLVRFDYGQIELVMLAHFIGYGALYDGFHDGVDAHTTTASMVFREPSESVSGEMRDTAKGLNFAIVYSAGPATVAEMAGCSVQEAEQHMRTHREMFPEIYKYKHFIINQAKREKEPHVRTLLGRKRRLPDLLHPSDELRAAAERQCFNAHIQGSAADVIKLAMTRLLSTLPPGAELILTVHDELVCHCPEEIADDVVQAMKEAMIGKEMQERIRVPLTCDYSVVDRWSEAK